MKRELGFNVPFSGFTTTDFINCFTSTLMVLEGITGKDDYECKQRNGQPCNGCGNCRRSTAGLQEQRFFVYDTMCGRSSLRCRYDGEPTEMQELIGETEAGARMASSHTGHLTGSDAVVNGLFAQHAVTRVADLDELLDTASLFAKLPFDMIKDVQPVAVLLRRPARRHDGRDRAVGGREHRLALHDVLERCRLARTGREQHRGDRREGKVGNTHAHDLNAIAS